MSGINNLQNLCIHSLGKDLSNKVSQSLESQITGQQDLQKNQVNQAIYLDTNTMIAKTEGALQNIKIASEFVSTAMSALETVNEDVISASQAVMNLLNGTVSNTNKEAAADGIINIMGMKADATSRDEQEGSVVKALRQSGTGSCPFYTLNTTEGETASIDTAPPAAVHASSDGIFFNSNGSVPENTFADPALTQVTLTGFSAEELGDPSDPASSGLSIDPTTITAVAADTDIANGIIFTVPVASGAGSSGASDSYISDAVELKPGQTINLYKHASDGTSPDRTKFITITTAADISGMDSAAASDGAAAQTALQSLMTGTFDAEVIPAPSKFTATPEPVLTGAMSTTVTLSNVPGGTFSGHAVDFENNEMTVKVGNNIYSIDPNDPNISADLAFDPTGTPATVATLYLNGDSLANPNSYIRITTDAASSVAAYADDATLLADFVAVLSGEHSASKTAVTTPFAFTPGSNYGAGYFTMNYDGSHLSFTDQFGDLVQSYPLDQDLLLEAAAGDGKVKVGNIGTLYIDESYAGGGFEKGLTATPTAVFDAIVTVSASEGLRGIEIPNLTDRQMLWGADATIDRDRLVRDTSYQMKIKGMLDHAAQKIKETIQSLSNILSTLNSDERSQNSSMESLSNLQTIVSAADPLETAYDVFENTRAYTNMIDAMYITATVLDQESKSASRIAQLAAQ